MTLLSEKIEKIEITLFKLDLSGNQIIRSKKPKSNMESYAKGTSVLFMYNGTWSAIVDEVVRSGSTYLIRFDGCVVPPDVKEAWPQGNEFLTVGHEEIEPRDVSSEDAAKREAWLSAVHYWRKLPSNLLHERFWLINRGQTVSWAVNTDNHLQEFSGVVKSRHAVGTGFCLVYTGDVDKPTKMVSVALLD